MRAKTPHLLVGLIVALVCLAGGLEPVERLGMDLRFRMTHRAVEAPVVVVAIDPASLARLSVWPWPRGYHATVLERLLAAGADRVAFDLDFSSHSDPDEDGTFAAALASAGPRAVLPRLRRWQPGPAGGGALMIAEPLEALRSRATIAGINIRPESDGLTRRYWPVDSGPPGDVPSLALALAGSPSLRRDPFYIDYGIDAGAIRRIPYVDVLTGQFDPGAVRGRAVIVGATSVELGDQVAVPVHVTLPGPLLQALAFTCLHAGRGLIRPSVWTQLPAALLLVLLAGPILQRASWRRGLVALLAMLLAIFLAGLAAQAYGAILLDLSPAGLMLAGSYGSGLARRIDHQRLRLLTQAARARAVEARMRHVVENSLDAIVTVSDTGRIETFNRAAETLFGLTAAEAVGRPIETIVEDGFDEPAAPSGGGTPAERERRCETTGRRRDGTSIPLEVAVTSFPMDGRTLRVGFLRDITQRRAQQRRLEHQAGHDALTDLPNRLTFRSRALECLERSRRHGASSAFLLLDLDRFKEINDTLGHDVGDRLLEAIAVRLRRPLGPDQTLARIGGDEFAAVLPGCGRGEALETAGRLSEELKSPFDHEGLMLQVEASIGVAIYPDHGTDPDVLLRRADVAMYEAKRLHGAVAVYDRDRDLNSVRHLALRGELREAIERGDLVLHYQPKVSARTGLIEGVEALVRWRHPRHGLLPPAEFIPLAETTGLMSALTAWVLDEAIRRCAGWERQGRRLGVAVNCSARNLLEEDLPGAVARRLAENGLPAERLMLELTETAIIEDPERSLRVLGALADVGVRLSIDDFGTGYSSLDQVRRLPASELKIDKSFVMGIDRDGGSAVIVRSTIDLAHNLGLRAVAEGVDSEEAWRLLKGFGCDLGQGYHLGRPMPAEELTVRLEAERPSPPRAADRAAAREAGAVSG